MAWIMTFFGHGTTTGFDLNVDSPKDWDNNGKYPVVMANSCYSGNIHLPSASVSSISEEYVLISGLGAIAFLATPGLGDPRYLNTYTGRLHRHISELDYGKSLAEQMQLAANSIAPNTANNNLELAYIGMGLEMTLHGDPAFMLNPHENPEMSINDPGNGPQVRFDPAFITTDVDSFDVIVDVTNLGRSVKGPIELRATRSFPTSKQDEIQFHTLDGIGYKAEVVFRFGVEQGADIGQNELTIQIDLPGDSIPEFDNYTNNEITSMQFEIIDGDIAPVFPYNFAVVPNFELTLRANTGYPFAPSREYTIQIDTTDTYDSPFFTQFGSQKITQSGAIVEWNPGLNAHGFLDSTVFFWRVAPVDDLSKWREYSFQVIASETGWGQDHFYQFKNNNYDFITGNRNNRRFVFEEASRELYVNVIGSSQTQSEHDATRFELDGQGAPLGERGVEPGGQAAMAIVVIDTIDLAPWGCYGYDKGTFYNTENQFGNSNNYLDDPQDNRARPEYFFSFEARKPEQMDSMISMITEKIPDGYYLLAYTLRYADFQDTTYWKDEHFTAFEALCADSIRYVENRNPYIFFTRKGFPNTSREEIGRNPTDIIDMREKIISTVKQGSISGPVVGPAMNWESFHLKSRKLEPIGDAIEATVTSTNLLGSEIIEQTLIASGTGALSTIDADSVLDLNLDYHTSDNENGTPSQLASWHLLFDPAPDAAVNPVLGTALRASKISAGEAFHFGAAIQNISDYDFGKFMVRYWLTNQDGDILQADTIRYDKLLATEVIFDSIEIRTIRLKGRHTLWMEVNPMDTEWHKEEYAFNNRAYRSFTVDADRNNPLLDVTFDGVHILNGDIVSPTPEIVMELKDDNTYILMTDTTSFDVFLSNPTGQQHRIPFIQQGAEIMQFEPALDSKNKARVTYRPAALANGTYTLSVMGRDATGNASGSENYSIEFEVINESMVTQVMNYPNPFTTSTRFVFTLTGTKIPDVFTIQILSITGKVVREITKDELGPMHIGRNISEYAWDGTDEYGDRLANGVYMYRAIMKIDGDHIDRLESDADQYFKKEFGKMYLFR